MYISVVSLVKLQEVPFSLLVLILDQAFTVDTCFIGIKCNCEGRDALGLGIIGLFGFEHLECVGASGRHQGERQPLLHRVLAEEVLRDVFVRFADTPCQVDVVGR